MIVFFIAFLAALTASLVITPCVREGAKRLGWVDTPDESRKLHASPTPCAGGLAIYLALLVSALVVYCLPAELKHNLRIDSSRAAVMVGMGGLMMLIGFRDDLKTLPPWLKFAAQMAAALLAWALGFRILAIWSVQGGMLDLGVLSLPITLLWIVLITNAFNLIDGIDGLSTGAALLAMSAMILVSALHQQWLSVLLLSALAGAALGFLRHNFFPASIFLGDSGSLLLGFMLAVLGIESSEKSSTAVAIAVPIVAFGFPVLDTLMSILRRFLSGKPIFTADRRHIHHILIERGLKPRHVVMLLYGVCGLFGLFSLLFMNPSGRTLGFALAFLGVCIFVGIQQLHYPELKELNGYLTRGIQHQRELLAGNVVIGKMIAAFRSARNPAELLASLGTALEELEFSKAEVRLPGFQENRLVLRVKDWRTLVEGRLHCLYQWHAEYSGPAAPGIGGRQPPATDRMGLGHEFRLEYVFKVPGTHGTAAAATEIDENRGRDVGRLTFYHPVGSRFPVSAICVLSRNVWSEFADAIGRIMPQQNAGLGRNQESMAKRA